MSRWRLSVDLLPQCFICLRDPHQMVLELGLNCGEEEEDNQRNSSVGLQEQEDDVDRDELSRCRRRLRVERETILSRIMATQNFHNNVDYRIAGRNDRNRENVQAS